MKNNENSVKRYSFYLRKQYLKDEEYGDILTLKCEYLALNNRFILIFVVDERYPLMYTQNQERVRKMKSVVLHYSDKQLMSGLF